MTDEPIYLPPDDLLAGIKFVRVGWKVAQHPEGAAWIEKLKDIGIGVEVLPRSTNDNS